MTIEADPANQDVLHAGTFFLGGCPPALVETRAHFEFNAELFSKFHGARLHYLCAAAGHFEQFVVSDLVEFLRFFYNSRIAGENSIDVGEDLTRIGVQGARQRNRRQVRAAASQRRGFAFWSLPLKTRDDHDVIVR